MANAPNTKSTLTFGSGDNKTSTSLSTNILILVGNTPVGAVKTLSITETRSIKQIDELGTDGHIDSCPTKSTDISGSCERIRFDRLRISEAFSRGFIHVASQAYPFDIVIIDRQKSDIASQISTVIKNVWIKNISYSYNSDEWVISEKMDWEAERIYSILTSGSGVPVAQGGERGIKYNNVNIERIADTGYMGQGGSLDASGLIDLGSDGNLF
jgi:hypothetical protein